MLKEDDDDEDERARVLVSSLYHLQIHSIYQTQFHAYGIYFD